MKHILFLTLIIILISCDNQTKKIEIEESKILTIVNEDYELIKANDSKVSLILFPGGGTTSKETKEEFNIIEKATEKGISVLLMNFNRRLWIENEDSEKLTKLVIDVLKENDLNNNQIFIGGMSIGGNVALTLSDHLFKINSPLKPNGVFIVDSPIDLFALYNSAQKDMANKDFSEDRLAEPKWIINYFEEEFGGKDSLFSNIQKVSPFTLKTKNTENIKNLKDSKLRLYTEPDTLWWKKNRQTDFEYTNAFVIQKTAEILSDNNWKNVELIQTKDKGYRANGERHPHSWSIVDVNNLITWMVE